MLYSYLYSTDSEIRGDFTCIKRGVLLQTRVLIITQQVFLPEIYGDSQTCLDILAANTATSRVKYVAVPIHFYHEKIHLEGRLKPEKVDTNLHLANTGTKLTPSVTFFCQFDHALTCRFYPKQGIDHYK